MKVTNKLYYEDAYRKNFTTSGKRQEQDENGSWFIILADTCFYPTGGGQPHDEGKLNGVKVQNVEEINGEIRHYIEHPLEDMDIIEGEIDWKLRFDHMQQHLGQHILTAAFVEF